MEKFAVAKTAAEIRALEADGYELVYIEYFVTGNCPTFTFRKPKRKVVV